MALTIPVGSRTTKRTGHGNSPRSEKDPIIGRIEIRPDDFEAIPKPIDDVVSVRVRRDEDPGTVLGRIRETARREGYDEHRVAPVLKPDRAFPERLSTLAERVGAKTDEKRAETDLFGANPPAPLRTWVRCLIAFLEMTCAQPGHTGGAISITEELRRATDEDEGHVPDPDRWAEIADTAVAYTGSTDTEVKRAILKNELSVCIGHTSRRLGQLGKPEEVLNKLMDALWITEVEDLAGLTVDYHTGVVVAYRPEVVRRAVR
jgi:hypothetical protein